MDSTESPDRERSGLAIAVAILYREKRSVRPPVLVGLVAAGWPVSRLSLFSSSNLSPANFPMDFWFLLKKGVSVYIHPLTIAMELIVLGIVLVGFSRRRGRKKPGGFLRWLRRASGDLGVAAVISGVFFLFLASIKPIADPLVYSLEKRYPPLRLDQMTDREIAAVAPEHIVVLAGGERFDPGKPPTSQLSYAGLARVNEGVRLARLFPEADVVFTGQPDEVRAMTESAIDLGVSKDRIVTESESRDTKDHPRFLRPIVGDGRFLLVTSGTHMPRAMALFEAEGLEPIAASCDLWVWPRFGDESPYQPEYFIPKIEHLWMTHIAFHEYLGLAWAKVFEAAEERGAVVQSEPATASETQSASEQKREGVKDSPAPASVPLPLPGGGEETESTPSPPRKSEASPPAEEEEVEPSPEISPGERPAFL